MNKSKLIATLIIFLIRLVSKLSLRWAQRLGGWLGALTWRCNAGPARVTRTNLQRCFPEKSAAEINALGAASMRETGKVAFETGAVWEWPAEKTLSLIKSIDGEHLIKEAEDAGKGLILLAPHLGNWEVAGLFFAARYSMAALYQPPKIEELDDYMRAVRERNGSELVPANKRGVMRLFHILREQGVIGILPDQEPELSGGVFAPFFGIPANTIKLVSKLIERTDAKVLCVYAKRLPEGEGFVMTVRSVAADIYSEDLETSAAALNATVEVCVRETPEQYQWEYKRFKRRPDGERHFYD
ncbi:lysophospholipid acyltransferase family protein [Hahella sp. CR1]|uniref:lysophospholipid acyltransferase family protein n=1 Tax=Hahella sp. CR1 TaxID=2992807 RepID=UPI002441A49B|nr:lysophospholipid acyltransferase family protein [Hahella sp. CR1]MDG9666471.1 lysophospholipid acyltransferase family protein [Hahella sp. CR1]